MADSNVNKLWLGIKGNAFAQTFNPITALSY